MSDGVMPEGILARLDRLSGIGYSDDGLVRATIDGSGIPDVVTIDPAALRIGARALGEAVVTALRAALDDVRSQAAGLIQDDIDTSDFNATPSSVDEAARNVTRQAEQAMAEIDEVRRRLLDRLPES